MNLDVNLSLLDDRPPTSFSSVPLNLVPSPHTHRILVALSEEKYLIFLLSPSSNVISSRQVKKSLAEILLSIMSLLQDLTLLTCSILRQGPGLESVG